MRHGAGPSTGYWLASTLFSGSHIHPTVQMAGQAARLPLVLFTERQHQQCYQQHHETHLHGNGLVKSCVAVDFTRSRSSRD